MKQDPTMSIMAGGTVGVIGLLTAFQFPVFGVPILVIGLLLVFGPMLWKMRGGQPAPKITHEMRIETPEQTHREMMNFIADPNPPVRGELSALIRTLRQANLNPRVAVLLDDNDEPLLTVQDVLDEMVTQAKRLNLSIGDLTNNAVTLYDRLYDNVEAACKAEQTVDGVCVWLANRCLKDVFPKLEGKPETKREQPNRFEL